jgi:hypothetical protein
LDLSNVPVDPDSASTNTGSVKPVTTDSKTSPVSSTDIDGAKLCVFARIIETVGISSAARLASIDPSTLQKHQEASVLSSTERMSLSTLVKKLKPFYKKLFNLFCVNDAKGGIDRLQFVGFYRDILRTRGATRRQADKSALSRYMGKGKYKAEAEFDDYYAKRNKKYGGRVTFSEWWAHSHTKSAHVPINHRQYAHARNFFMQFAEAGELLPVNSGVQRSAAYIRRAYSVHQQGSSRPSTSRQNSGNRIVTRYGSSGDLTAWKALQDEKNNAKSKASHRSQTVRDSRRASMPTMATENAHHARNKSASARRGGSDHGSQVRSAWDAFVHRNDGSTAAAASDSKTLSSSSSSSTAMLESDVPTSVYVAFTVNDTYLTTTPGTAQLLDETHTAASKTGAKRQFTYGQLGRMSVTWSESSDNNAANNDNDNGSNNADSGKSGTVGPFVVPSLSSQLLDIELMDGNNNTLGYFKMSLSKALAGGKSRAIVVRRWKAGTGSFTLELFVQ